MAKKKTKAKKKKSNGQAGVGGKADVHLNKSGRRKSTRLNSSHTVISYAVFCLKKKKQPKKKNKQTTTTTTHDTKTNQTDSKDKK